MTTVLEGRPTGNVTVEAGAVAGGRGTDTVPVRPHPCVPGAARNRPGDHRIPR